MEKRAQDFLSSLSSELRNGGNTVTADVVEQAHTEHTRSHWHEMCEALLTAIRDPMVLDRGYELHEQVLLSVRADISPIAYVKLVQCICFSSNSTLEKALDLVGGACASLMSQGATLSKYAVQCIQALLLLEDAPNKELAAIPGSGPHTARKILEEVEAYIHTLRMHEVDPLLVALQCRARCRDFELRRQYTRYYKTAFDIVTYSEKAEMPLLDVEINLLAYKTALSALLSEEIFNFGKLLNFAPFVNRLATSAEHSWVLEWIRLCNEGDVEGFQVLYKKHISETNRVPDLVEAADQLHRKVRLMTLLHMVFYTPFNERTFTFDAIARRCGVADNEAETLLLTALAQGIIRGRIDGLLRKVHISWVEPRVLSLKEVKELAVHVSKWRERVLDVTSYVSEMAAQLPQ